MKIEHIVCLIEDVDTVIKSQNSNLCFEDKEKLKSIKEQLELDSKKIFDLQTAASVVQAIVAIAELYMKK